MNMLLWIFIGVLTLIGLGFVIKPLLFYKEIESKFIAEALDSRKPYSAAAILMFVIPTMGVSCYLYWGNSRAVDQWRTSQKNAAIVQQEIVKFSSRESIILMLRQKLYQLPASKNTAKGWHVLGKLYLSENKGTQAIQAYKKAAELAPNQADYLLDYISAKFYCNHLLSPQDKHILIKVMRLAPGNVNAINLLALDAYQHHSFAEAVRHWESLLPYFSPESEDAKNLLQMIYQAQLQTTKK